MTQNSLIYIALIGTFCLLLSATIPTNSRISLASALVTFSFFFMVGTLSMGPLFRSLGYVDNTAPEGLIAENLTLLRQDLPTANIILIEGGSYTSRGLNRKLLQKILISEGYSATVVQFSMPGANHLERYHVLRRFISELSKEEKSTISESNLIIMNEIQLGYDINPLAGFERNEFSDRTYAYLFPRNALLAWKVLSENKTSASNGISFRVLLNHSIVNVFNIGLIRRVVHSAGLKRVDGFQPLEATNKKYIFTGLAERAIFFKKKPSLPFYSHKWLTLFREKNFYSLFESMEAKHFIFFSVACVHSSYQQYANSFCVHAHADKKKCLDATDPSLLYALDQSELWHDGGHLTRKGSDVYTNWFAGRLIESGVLVK